MIYATVNMTIGDYSSTCDNKILLYRGDKNVEIRIVMKGNKFTVLDSTYAQMIIRRPSATSVFSEPAPIQNDTVIFVITEDMIDELKEIGEYTFQIRLYDDTMTARATLPPCKSALIIERPIAVEGEAAVNLAIVNDSAVMLADTTISEEDIFTEDNKYNRTIWVDGDLITDTRLNKIEEALYYINENGGGGGGSATAPYISTELPETVMVGSDENFDLHLFFNSPNIGKGTLRVFVNDVDSMSVKIDQGDSTTVVSSNLFAKGTNRVVVYVLDRVGVMSNSLVFYIRYGSTEISSDFDPYSAYDYGATIRYYFTPTALDTSLTLTFYMSIDGQVQQGINCTSDTRGYYTFPTNLSADSHYCEAYVVDSKGVKSNVLSFNLIILDADTLVVASDTKEVSVEEGEQVSLDYKVYMKYNTSFIANIYVDDALVNTGTCNADFNYYKTSSLTKGVHTVKLEIFDVTETHSDYITWTVAVSDSTYEMLQPVNAGAMFIGTAVNKTNTDERKQYFIGHDQEGNEVLGTLTNFAYNSESGWVNDELIISGNSHVEIPVQPLANNAKYGFTLDIEFTSKQIGVPDAEVLTLWNDETNCGVKITTEKLILQSSNGNKCDLYFTDNERTHVMFVIDRQELKAKIYLNGVMCEAFHLNDYTVEGVAYLDDFTVNSNIILGGLNKNGYCKIRNLRVYQVALTTDEIMNNFISCEIDKAKQRELSEFQKGNDLPTLYVYCDFSGLGKDDKKPCKIVYNSTNEALYGKSFNLDHKQSQLQYQGTSSMAYPIKNYRLNLRDENGDKWYYTLPTAQPECRFTLKADFMSSGHWTNTGMAKFINDKLYNYNVNDEKSMNPFKWEHVQNGGKVNDFRETISGFPCRLILVNDGETPLNTGQNEPTPGNTKDMGIFNFNNDKDNVTTLGFNSDIFPNCASYEVTANSDTSAGAFMSYSGDGDEADELAYLKESFELRHPDEDDVAEDWGFMGVETTCMNIASFVQSGAIKTSWIKSDYFGDVVELQDVEMVDENQHIFLYSDNGLTSTKKSALPIVMTINDPTYNIAFGSYDTNISSLTINGVKYYLGDTCEKDEVKDPYESTIFDTSYGLKALIDWVDNCTDEEFVRDFEEHFHKDYTLRYFCLVTLIGAVDNLGKNMMLDTADNKIYFPRFYDIDTICSYDNSGQLKFDVDIEMEQGYWNTSSSRLWTRVRDLMHDDIVTTYNDMRQNGVSYENMMKYIYDEQIAKIPQAYYNKDYDVKYAPFADSYIGMAHGDTYEHVKRWLKQRFAFVDTLFDYAPSYNNDILTIRANTTELMTLEIETYTPVYQHLSWYNGQMDKKKIDGKVSVEFSGKAQAATDQEVLIYGGSNVKSIKGIQSANPNRLILGSATKLTELDASNCPLLAEINMNKANLSPHEYLNKVNLSNCPSLEGNLRLNNSPLIQELDIRGTKITGMNLPSSIRNLQVLKLPNTMTELTLNDAGMLHTLEFDEGVALQSISMTNCNALTNVVNFDLLQTPSIVLNNSYNTAAELYFRDTTNLSLSNMSNLERVIFTPNNEYETFELINVANAPNYTISTFNCPKLSTFMTTAPYRESYNNCGMVDKLIFRGDMVNKEINFLPSDMVFTNRAYINYITGEFMTDGNNSASSATYVPIVEGVTYTLDYAPIETKAQIVLYKDAMRYTKVEGESYYSDVPLPFTFTVPEGYKYLRFHILIQNINVSDMSLNAHGAEIIQAKDYGNIQPNTTFTANSIDISNTQFTDVKLLCTTDTNTLKLPTTVKNFYCDSSFDLDTDYLEDGEYDVVHGEFVEPYTTDYEGEVVRSIYNTILVRRNTLENIPVVGGTILTYTSNSDLAERIQEYDSNNNLLKSNNTYTIKTLDSSTGLYKGSIILNSNTGYINIIASNTNEFKVTLTEPYTPNLIPSAADGSLIFSMYAPSNTVAPASGIWDLHGLEFDNFHTFGMNNDVKPSEDSFMSVIDASNIVAFTGKVLNGDRPMGDVHWDSGQRNTISITCLKLKAGVHIILTDTDRIGSIAYATDIGENTGILYTSVDTTVGHFGKFNLTTDAYIAINFPSTAEYITIDGNYLFIKDLTILDGETLHTSGFFNAMDYTSPIVFDEVTVNQTLGDITSLSMPSRYDDYNITIKNAYIAPKTHNTMLYPLLVNENNPITGTLDYTNYAGKHLSWSFAYTDEEHVNIIQPKDELLNSYEYRYNAFYDTEYEFDNPYEVAKYTSSVSGVLPSFNTEFAYTYDEKDNGNGTYTIKVYADSLDNLPTKISFTANNNLLTVDKLNTSKVTTMFQMFRSCANLTRINCRLDTSSVKDDISQMFVGCSNLEYVDATNLVGSNIKYAASLFSGCTLLNQIDGLDTWDTSKVTSMNSMFSGCKALTSLNLSNWDTSNVTDISSMFYGCNELTSLDVSGFETGNVTAMNFMFYGCSKLTSLNLSGFDTSSVTNMKSMFQYCSELTSLDVSGFETGNVTAMNNMFCGCSKLTSLNLSGFDTSSVTNMKSMFRDCNKLTSLDLSEFDTKNVIDMGDMFRDCRSLTSLDLSGFNTSKVTNMDSMFYGCSVLTSLNVSNWSLDKVNTIIPQLPVNPSTSTLYGTVIIDESTLPSGWVYEFDNVLEIARYTSSAAGIVPTFNNGFTGYNVSEINNNNTYTVSITTDSLDNLPTSVSFNGKNTLLTVDKLNTKNVTNMSNMFKNCKNLTSLDLSRLDTNNVTNMSGMFHNCNNLTSLDVSRFNTSKVTNMDSMFCGCNKLTSLDLSGFDTSKVDNMDWMFAGCNQLTSIDLSGFDTSIVTSMKSMFQYCYELTSLDLSGFNTSKVTNMVNMFNGCKALTSLDVSGFDTSEAINIWGMFQGCSKLTALDLSGFDTRKVTTMTLMFSGCKALTSLDLSNWDTSNVTDMSSMFSGCIVLTHLDVSGNYVKRSELDDVIRQLNALRSDVDNLLQNNGGEVLYYNSIMPIENDGTVKGFNTSKVTNMANMFNGCSKLTELDLSTFDTSNVTDMTNMFYGCSGLTSLDLSKWDASKVENMSHAFFGCSSITELNLSGFTNVKDWGSFCRYCTKLVSITGLDISKYSTNFGVNDQKYLSFQGCTSLRNIKDLNVSFTSAMAKANSNSINNDYWMICGWGWFNGLTNLVDITFTGHVELYDTMPVYYIFIGCDTTKFTHATWNTFVSIFPTTSTSKSIVLGGTQAILDAVPDEIKLALTQKGYTLIFRE